MKLRRWFDDRSGEVSGPRPLRLSVPTRLRVRIDDRCRLLHVFVLDPSLASSDYWRDVVALRHAGNAPASTLECDPGAILAEVRRSIRNEQTFEPAYRTIDEAFAQRWAGVGHQIAIHERMVGLPQPFGIVNSVTSAALTASTLEVDEATVAMCAQAVVRDSYAATRVRFAEVSSGPHVDLGAWQRIDLLSLVRDRWAGNESIRDWVNRFPFDADTRDRWCDDLVRAAFFGDARFAHGVMAATRAVVEHGDHMASEALTPSMV